MKTFVIENTWLSRSITNFGWGNGYVVIPKEHPLNGFGYDEINVDVHGGLTFAEPVDNALIKWNDNLSEKDIGGWVVGFDTAHYGDNLKKWPKHKVEEETERLKEQLLNYTA